MAYAFPGAGALDYAPCRYGESRLIFRGPHRPLEERFIACLGGSETYGKFVPHPFPALLEEAMDVQVLNLGCINAGLDVFLQDSGVLDLAGEANLCILQITGAQNLSNRYYSVHPRRNDRFLAATPLLRALFRDVDFTEFSFTRHLLGTLRRKSIERMEVVAEELRAVWVARMKELLGRLRCPTVLLWMADSPPPSPDRRSDLLTEPLLVDADMVAAVRPLASAYLELVPSPSARRTGAEGMAFGPLDAPAAATLPGPAVHHEVAERLLPIMNQLM